MPPDEWLIDDDFTTDSLIFRLLNRGALNSVQRLAGNQTVLPDRCRERLFFRVLPTIAIAAPAGRHWPVGFRGHLLLVRYEMRG
jgi:hypothetical protein